MTFVQPMTSLPSDDRGLGRRLCPRSDGSKESPRLIRRERPGEGRLGRVPDIGPCLGQRRLVSPAGRAGRTSDRRRITDARSDEAATTASSSTRSGARGRLRQAKAQTAANRFQADRVHPPAGCTAGYVAPAKPDMRPTASGPTAELADQPVDVVFSDTVVEARTADGGLVARGSNGHPGRTTDRWPQSFDQRRRAGLLGSSAMVTVRTPRWYAGRPVGRTDDRRDGGDG